MKKIASLFAAVTVALSLVTISANAGNISGNKSYAEAMAEAYNDIHSTTFRTLVAGVQDNFINQGYSIVSNKGTHIKAIKTNPSEEEIAQNQKKEFKKNNAVKTPTLTATFVISENGYAVKIENGYDIQSYNEWADMVGLRK